MSEEQLSKMVADLLAGRIEGDERRIAEVTLTQPVLEAFYEYVPRGAGDPPIPDGRYAYLRAERGLRELDARERMELAERGRWALRRDDFGQQNIRRLSSLLFTHRVYTQLAEALPEDESLVVILRRIRAVLADQWRLPDPPVGAGAEREVAREVGAASATWRVEVPVFGPRKVVSLDAARRARELEADEDVPDWGDVE